MSNLCELSCVWLLLAISVSLYLYSVRNRQRTSCLYSIPTRRTEHEKPSTKESWNGLNPRLGLEPDQRKRVRVVQGNGLLVVVHDARPNLSVPWPTNLPVRILALSSWKESEDGVLPQVVGVLALPTSAAQQPDQAGGRLLGPVQQSPGRQLPLEQVWDRLRRLAPCRHRLPRPRHCRAT